MTRRSLERRLAALQAKRAPAAPVGIAWQDVGERGRDETTVERVVAGGPNERMPLDEWRRRYPHGLLICVVHSRKDADEPALENLNKAR
jgi:hypothetical protein